jgi:hypothetical protein
MEGKKAKMDREVRENTPKRRHWPEVKENNFSRTRFKC